MLVKLGLVPPDVVFHANNSIYGLRRGPYDWQSERADKLHKARAKAAGGHKYGNLELEELDECKGLFVVRDTTTTQVVGILAMFVDDAFIFGPRDVNLRVKQLIAQTWEYSRVLDPQRGSRNYRWRRGHQAG